MLIDLNGNLINTSNNTSPGQVTITGRNVNAAEANINSDALTGDTNAAQVQIVSLNGDITIGGISAKPSGNSVNGAVILTANNGDINVGGPVTSNGKGSLTVNLTGATPGDAIFAANNNSVDFITSTGGGTITYSNGSSPLHIGPIGTTQSIVYSTTSPLGINVSAPPISTTGTIILNTPAFTFNSPVQAANILVQNLSGSLTVTGGASATLTGTTPAAGSPGNPSNPAAITFATASGQNLNLFGNITFTGDVLLSNPNGTTTSNAGSLLTGNNNITLKTATWTQLGGGNIVANNLIFSGFSIINPMGSVTLNDDFIYSGRDLAIAAFGDIILGNYNISSASSTANGGNITLLAGFTFSPTDSSQLTQLPYIITGFNPAGGSITGTGDIDSSSTFAGGSAGSVTAIAHLGSVSLGSINASASAGAGGDVSIYGGNGVSTSNINAGGMMTSGDVTASVSEVQIVGTPVIDAGSLSPGLVPTGVKAAGAITIGAVTAGAFINLEGLGAVNVNGALSANSITIDTDKTGFLTLTGVTSITATTDAGNNGGSINLDIKDFSSNGGASLTLNANSGVGGNGGTINFTTTDVVNLGSFLLLNATGDKSGGTINVATDFNIGASGGLNAAGSDGRGAVITLTAPNGFIDLFNRDFLNQIDGTGAAGDGGGLALIAATISTSTSPTAPLPLSAKGSGTGNGGSITYIATDPISTYIGSNPAKPPKGFVNYLTFDAQSGATGGNGGSVNVLSGGNLTVDPSAISVGPRGVNGNGGFITLEADNRNGKTGSLVVLGDLSANGAGVGPAGAITLRSDSKKAFTVGGTKTPKNGVMGSLSAGTLNGNVVVINNGGGVTVSVPNAITSGNVALQAALKGSIAQGKGVVIAAGNTLTLTTDAGAIGKKPLLVNARNLVLNSNSGSANVQDLVTGDITLASNAGVGGDLSVGATSGGITVLTNLITSSGDINLTASGGTLRVNAGLNVQANNGALTLANLDTTSGDILIQDGASVQTAGKGGQVVLAIGEPPKKGTTSATPANVNPSEIGKGKIYFGPGGVVVPVGPANVTAMNKNVIFNNLSTGGKLITLGSNTLVKADPPLKDSALPRNESLAAAFESTTTRAQQSGELMTAPNVKPISNFSFSDLLATSAARTASQTSSMLGSLNSLINIATVDGQAINDTKAGITNSLTTAGSCTRDGIDESAVINLAANTTDDSAAEEPNSLIIDAHFQSDKDAYTSSTNSIAGLQMKTVDTTSGAENNSRRHVLSRGNVLFAPSTTTIVETNHGNVELAAGVVALIMQSEQGLSVYDLHDNSKDAVVINANGKRISLSPGRHASVSHTAHDGFAYANPIELVQYRNIQQAKHNGASVYTTEFSIPSACYAVKPLKQLLASNQREANVIAKRIIKTTAVLSTIAPDKGDFVQFFKTQTTAMLK